MRISVFVIGLFIVLFAPLMAYSHCHNDAYYENPLTVRGNRVWSPSEKNDDGYYEIFYWINRDKTNMPPLETDVRAAASTWSKVDFLSRKIKFMYTYEGRLNIPDTDVLRKDNKNVVGWYNLQRNGPPAGTKVWNDGNRIEEVDILLNYYEDYTTHANRAAYPAYYCLKEVMTHEFGHGAGLKDVYYLPNGNNPDMWWGVTPIHWTRNFEC